MTNTRNLIIDRRVKLQGYAVGYEILQNGITVKAVTFDAPVKNLVVNTGKDIFCAPGINLNSGQKDGVSLAYATQWMARGSGSTPTTVGMTSLESQIGTRTNQYLSGHPNTGVRYDRESGVIYLRRTYDSQAEVSNQNINEVGFFTAQTSGVMFSRIVLPSTVTVLTGQQLRLTYELQITVGPVAATPYSPTITGWTTTGDAQLEGLFPATSPTFSNAANQFIGVWDTSGLAVSPLVVSNGRGNNLLEPSMYYSSGSERYAGTAQPISESVTPFVAYNTKAFSSFGTIFNAVSADANTFVAGQPFGVSSGTSSSVLSAYTPGSGYRDRTITLEPNWPSSDISPIAIRYGGLTHIFDSAQTKLSTQRLTITARITIV